MRYDDAEISRLYRAGATLAELGSAYGVTRERMRQIIKSRNLGESKDCGVHKRAAERREKRARDIEERHLKKWGFSRKERREQEAASRRIGAQSPYRAYLEQRKNAKKRAIEWAIKFSEWLELWGDNLGHRGRRDGQLVMCRYGDHGPYKIGNVYIATVGHNHSVFRVWDEIGCRFEKLSVLPPGVVAIT